MEINKKDITSIILLKCMKERSMPICFRAEQYDKIKQIAKQKGMLNVNQLVEEALSEL